MLIAPHYHIHLIIIITTAIIPSKNNSREVYTDDRSWRRTYQVHAPSVPATMIIILMVVVVTFVVVVVITIFLLMVIILLLMVMIKCTE